jgi:hypothetical protein
VIGSRFELGRKIIFLLRSGKPYSITTSGHMNATRSAVPKANMVGIQWWLYLTVGGQAKISIDSARTMHVIDDEGKDRKVHIIQRIANQPPGASVSPSPSPL